MGKYSIFFVLRPSSHRQIRKVQEVPLFRPSSERPVGKYSICRCSAVPARHRSTRSRFRSWLLCCCSPHHEGPRALWRMLHPPAMHGSRTAFSVVPSVQRSYTVRNYCISRRPAVPARRHNAQPCPEDPAPCWRLFFLENGSFYKKRAGAVGQGARLRGSGAQRVTGMATESVMDTDSMTTTCNADACDTSQTTRPQRTPAL